MAILRPCNNCLVLQGVAYNSYTVQWCVVLYISTIFTQVGCLTITASINPTGILVLGSNMFNLTCDIVDEGADVFGTELARKRESDYDYVDIVSFPPPNLNKNVTYLDSFLETRTTSIRPVIGSLRATLTFKDIVCTDKASYRWTVNYYDTQQRTTNVTTNIESLKALSTFRNDGQITPTSSNRKEGDEYICQGNVGNVPIAELVWFVKNNNSDWEKQTQGVTTNPPTAESGNPCSYRRSSNLIVTGDMDLANVRCTAQQDVKTVSGDNNDNYKETGILSVMYGPTNLTILPCTVCCFNENDNLTFTCSAVSNPVSRFQWAMPAPSSLVIDDPVLQLDSLKRNDAGEYICIAQNTINGQIYNKSITVKVSLCASGRHNSSMDVTTNRDTGSNKDKTIAGAVGGSVAALIVVCVGAVAVLKLKGRPRTVSTYENSKDVAPGSEVSDKSQAPGNEKIFV